MFSDSVECFVLRRSINQNSCGGGGGGGGGGSGGGARIKFLGAE